MIWQKEYSNAHLLMFTKGIKDLEVGVHPIIAAKLISWILICG